MCPEPVQSIRPNLAYRPLTRLAVWRFWSLANAYHCLRSSFMIGIPQIMVHLLHGCGHRGRKSYAGSYAGNSLQMAAGKFDEIS